MLQRKKLFKKNRFHFLPGHRKFVLRLPEEIEKMKKDSCAKRPYKPRIRKKSVSAKNPMPTSNRQLPQAEIALLEVDLPDSVLPESVLHENVLSENEFELPGTDVFVHEIDLNGAIDVDSKDKTAITDELQYELITK